MAMTDQEVHLAWDEIIVGMDAGTTSDKQVQLKNRDGQYVNVDSLNVSDNVKQLLKAMDAEGNGAVDDENVVDMLHVLRTMKSVFGKEGKMSHSEIETGLGLLQRLVKEKDMNSGEMSYAHLPDCIQGVMSEWDIDRSGTVNVLELSAAAKAHKKVKEEGRLMKKIIFALFFVIIILLTGMLVMSYLAIEMSKEMRGNSDGIMQTNDGQVVKVASSAFDVNPDGTMVSRDGSSTLQVAQTKPSRQLSSTIPDDVLKKLDMVSLKQGDHFVQLKVNGMQRIKMKTSKCGSVVEFETAKGVLTLDDFTISADNQLSGYLQQAGLANVLEDGVFGRRLSAGLLDGFFTQMDNVEWACTSVALPRPEDIPQTYRAKIQIYERAATTDVTKSAFQSTNSETEELLIAGMVKQGEIIYKTWTEDVLKLQNLQVTSRRYAMHPLQSQISVDMAGGRAFIDRMGDVGHNCELGVSRLDTALESLMSKATNLQLVGLVHEGGMVLRNWRMEVTSSMTDAMSQNIIQQGFLQNLTIDYFDVDTDPMMKFESGYPYRINFLSEDATMNVTLQYLEMAPVADMDLQASLNFMGVAKMSATCDLQPIVTGQSAYVSLGQSIEQIGIEAAEKVPRIEPWAEWPGVVKYNSDKLKELVQLSATSPELKLARESKYWKRILSSQDHQALLTELAAKQIENGETSSQKVLGEGVTLQTQVVYSTSANSLPGGIEKIKVIAQGTRVLSEAGIEIPVDGELEISASSRGSHPYIKSCVVKASTMSTGPLSGEVVPVNVIMCLSEEFDYINFKMLIQGDWQPGQPFIRFEDRATFGVVDVLTRARQLCRWILFIPIGCVF
eukprot:symbB.v1.2.025715.t1/scaffold2509.1/size77380/2